MSLCLRQHLRHVEQRDPNLLQSLKQVAGSKLISIDMTRRYLQLSLIDDAGSVATGWIDTDAWCENTDSGLPGVAWQQIPLHYLACWLRGHLQPCCIADKTWTVQQITIPDSPLPSTLIQLPSRPYTFLCHHWPYGRVGISASPVDLLQQIPFTLRYTLGRSQLSLRLLLTIADGDLLCIENYAPLLMVGHFPLFHFCLTEDLEVFVEEPFVMSEDEKYRAEEEITFDWSELPVDIEFVLADMTLSISELDALEPGTQLPLHDDAEKRIKIYINRKLFARGELILLDNGSLAVEVNQINNLSIDQAGFTHAK